MNSVCQSQQKENGLDFVFTINVISFYSIKKKRTIGWLFKILTSLNFIGHVDVYYMYKNECKLGKLL